MLDNITLELVQNLDLRQATVKKGQFTHCYIFDDQPFVILHSIDILKECLALWSNFENNPHLPQIKRLRHEWFVMPKYAQLTAKHKTAWQQYKAIEKMHHRYITNRHYNYDVCLGFAQDVKNTVDIALGEAFEELINNGINATDNFLLDFKKVNFSVDNNGYLVLRDVLADKNKIGMRNFETIGAKVLYNMYDDDEI